MLLVKTMNPYNTDTIQLECLRKDAKMQEKKDFDLEEFKGALRHVCGEVAAVVEIEHRATGIERTDLAEIMARILSDEMGKIAMVSNELLMSINDHMLIEADALMKAMGQDSGIDIKDILSDMRGDSNVM